MIKLLKNKKNETVTLELDPFLVLIIPTVFLLGYLKEFIIIYITITLHELGHIVTAKVFGKKVYAVRILSVGLNVAIEEDTCSSLNRILIYISGPLVNIFFIAISLFLISYGPIERTEVLFFLSANICLLIMNMLPVSLMDGGRIFRELLSMHFGLFLAGSYLRKLSLILSIALIILGSIQLLTSKFNFSLLTIAIYIFFTLKTERTEAALMNAKYVIYRRCKLLKRGIYPARDLVVMKSTHLSDLLNCMDFDRFHLIHVLDDELRLIKILTEHEIMDGMLKYNSEMTFEEFIKRNQD